MSAAASDPNPGASTAASSPIPATAPPTKKKRRWRRLLLWTLIVLVVLAVAARITIALAFPSVLRQVAAAYGLDASYERMELYVLGGDVGLWHLRVAPKDGGEPLLTADYVRGDVSALNLLRGRLVVRRVEADGVDALAQREADGSIPILEKLLSGPPAPPSDAPMDVSLDPPLQVDALRLSRVRARWIDKAVQPPVDARVEVTKIGRAHV